MTKPGWVTRKQFDKAWRNLHELAKSRGGEYYIEDAITLRTRADQQDAEIAELNKAMHEEFGV